MCAESILMTYSCCGLAVRQNKKVSVASYGSMENPSIFMVRRLGVYRSATTVV
jgi:hypothetical protein